MRERVRETERKKDREKGAKRIRKKERGMQIHNRKPLKYIYSKTTSLNV